MYRCSQVTIIDNNTFKPKRKGKIFIPTVFIIIFIIISSFLGVINLYNNKNNVEKDFSIDDYIQEARDNLNEFDWIEDYNFNIVDDIKIFDDNCTGYVDYNTKTVYILKGKEKETIYHEIFHIMIYEEYGGVIPDYIVNFNINETEVEKFIKNNGKYYSNKEEMYAEIFSLYERRVAYMAERYESFYELCKTISNKEGIKNV